MAKNMTGIEIIKYILQRKGHPEAKKIKFDTNLFEIMTNFEVIDLLSTMEDIIGYNVPDKYIDNAKTVQEFINIFQRSFKEQMPNVPKNLTFTQRRELLNLRTKQVLYRVR